MPVTIQPTTLKYKDSNGQFISADCLKGDPVDVQVNGTSVVENGVADIPLASNNDFGVVKTGALGVRINNDGVLFVNPASIQSEVKPGLANYLPIVPSTQHASTFYGLAKAAGDATQSASANAVGVYTDEAKAAIQDMLGIHGVEVVRLA